MNARNFYLRLWRAKKTILLIILPTVFLAYLFTGCYCNVFPAPPVHVLSNTQSCVVVNIPEPWILSDGQRVFGTSYALQPVVRADGNVLHYEHYIFNQYKIRRSRSNPDVFFVALHNSQNGGEAPVSLTSKNRFVFRWPHASGAESTGVTGLRRATESEWESAIPLTSTRSSRGLPKPWYDTDSPFESWAGRYVELSRSKGGPYQGHGLLDFTGLFLDPIYNPPRWTWFKIFDVAEHKQIGAATVMSCDTSLLLLAAWHGESIFSIPVSNDQRNILLCGTAAPLEEESDVTLALPDSVTAAEPGPVARILSLREIRQDENRNGRTDLILISAVVDVTVAGSYSLLVSLEATNGKQLQEPTTMFLHPGIRQMWVTFRTSHVVDFIGVDGPYRRKAHLIYEGTNFLTNTLDAGSSFPYKLQSLDGPDQENR